MVRVLVLVTWSRFVTLVFTNVRVSPAATVR